MSQNFSEEGHPGRSTEDTEQDCMPSSEKLAIERDEERRHFKKVVSAFKSYRYHVSEKIMSNIQMVDNLPDFHKTLLQSYRKSLDDLINCVHHNQEICDLIVKDVEHIFDNTQGVFLDEVVSATAMDFDRVQSTLKQFVRDWSTLGASEREACYAPIINEVVSHYPPDSCHTRDISVLVPGAGLGRLAFEIAARGYKCQGNEFSLFMLFASNFVLNKIANKEVYGLYPWIHQVDNNLSAENQMQFVRFPDINPNTMLHSVNNYFSMAAGDFLEVYEELNSWDCIATCFFIDCANNICEFILKIYEILKPGGIWINLGPLLYHFSNMSGECSIEPSYNDVKNIIQGVGFILEKEEIGVKTSYGQNPHSMLQYEYRSVFFVCKKPEK